MAMYEYYLKMQFSNGKQLFKIRHKLCTYISVGAEKKNIFYSLYFNIHIQIQHGNKLLNMIVLAKSKLANMIEKYNIFVKILHSVYNV